MRLCQSYNLAHEKTTGRLHEYHCYLHGLNTTLSKHNDIIFNNIE